MGQKVNFKGHKLTKNVFSVLCDWHSGIYMYLAAPNITLFIRLEKAGTIFLN